MHLAYKYNILNAMRQQLRNEFTADGSSAPDVRSVRKQKSPPSSNDPSVITNDYWTIYSKMLHLLMDWWVLHDKVNKHRKFKCYTSVEKS